MTTNQLSKNFLQNLLDKQLLSHETMVRLSVELSTTLLAALLVKELNAKLVAKEMADHLALPVGDLESFSLAVLATDGLDEHYIKKHRVLPLCIIDNCLHLAISDPEHINLLAEIRFRTGFIIKPVVVEYDKVERLIDKVLSQHQYQLLSNYVINPHDNDQRIIQFVQQILADAIAKSVSDIHFEPYKNVYQIRLRIDGLLHKVAELPIELAQRIAARLKVLAKLDISERRLPQDGRFSIELEQPPARDCRISTCPTLFGEKIVIRILDVSKASLNIDDLGLEECQKEMLMQVLHRPQGMVLVTGATGSGKTVTLYMALNLLNTVDKNILTVEEPVEIHMPGINQVNINLKTGLNFSQVLRTFLRQDPDIIMVGEIRDKETAEIAIKAAQTGHLVLSTLHTNNAIETILRLISMGIAPFNIVQCLHLIIAQRLLRKLCVACKTPLTLSATALLRAGFKECDLNELIIYAPVGCEHCTKGYSGRIGVFELLPITDVIVELMLDNASTKYIAQAVQTAGWLTLRQAALNKVKMGVTSLAEINRVIMV
jgi:type IV pilus assembly protein PilB